MFVGSRCAFETASISSGDLRLLLAVGVLAFDKLLSNPGVEGVPQGVMLGRPVLHLLGHQLTHGNAQVWEVVAWDAEPTVAASNLSQRWNHILQFVQIMNHRMDVLHHTGDVEQHAAAVLELGRGRALGKVEQFLGFWVVLEHLQEHLESLGRHVSSDPGIEAELEHHLLISGEVQLLARLHVLDALEELDEHGLTDFHC